jgi:ABC-type glycerol-3-phosphate transport system substrate-binding protein
MPARATLVALLVLALAGCGGSDKAAPAQEERAPAAEGAPVPKAATPENCMLKAGLESIERQAKAWTAFHPDGYEVRVRRYGSPAAANQGVQAAPGIAEQANFYGVFAPVEDQANNATATVAKCLRGL